MAKYYILSEDKGDRFHMIKRLGIIKSSPEYGTFIQSLSYDKVDGKTHQTTMTIKPSELKNLKKALEEAD